MSFAFSSFFPLWAFFYGQANHLQIMFFATRNVMMAARIRIAVLIGVKEQVALYPSRHGLLAFELGMAVLIAAILNMIITAETTKFSAVICIVSPPLIDFSTGLFCMIHSSSQM